MIKFKSRIVITDIKYSKQHNCDFMHYSKMGDLIERLRGKNASVQTSCTGEFVFPADTSIGDVFVMRGDSLPRRPWIGARRAPHLVPDKS